MPCFNCEHFNAYSNSTTHDFEEWGKCVYPHKINCDPASSLVIPPDAGSTYPKVSREFSCGRWVNQTLRNGEVVNSRGS